MTSDISSPPAIVRTRNAESKIAQRDDKGMIRKGVSGNLQGRPTRERERAYMEMTIRNCSLEEWAQVVAGAVDDAINGTGQVKGTARKWLGEQLVGLPVKRIEAKVEREDMGSAQQDKQLLQLTAVLGAIMPELVARMEGMSKKKGIIEGDDAVVIENE